MTGVHIVISMTAKRPKCVCTWRDLCQHAAGSALAGGNANKLNANKQSTVTTS